MISVFFGILASFLSANPPTTTPSLDLARVEARCHLEKRSLLAEASLPSGIRARLSPGRLQIGVREFTHCDGLPGPHPLSLAAIGDDFVVGFRDVGAYRASAREGSWIFTKLDGLPQSPIRALAAQGDDLWIGTGTQGLWLASKEEAVVRVNHPIVGRRGITALRVHGKRVHIAMDPYGHFVRGTDGKIRRRSKEAIACFAPGPQLRPMPPGSSCRSAAERQVHATALASFGDTLVVGSFDQGIFLRNSEGILEAVAGSPRFVNALLSTDEGLYIGSAQGLYLWTEAKQKIRRVPLGIASEHVNALAQGKDGGIWIATSEGAARLQDGKIRVIGTAQGLPHRIVYSLATTDDGAVWLGTASGVLRLYDGEETLYTQGRGTLPHDWVTSLHAEGDTVLAGTYDSGVARLHPSGQSNALAGLESAWVTPDGVASVGDSIAVSTLGGGLWFYIGGEAYPGPALPSRDVTDVHNHKGTLWVATRAGLASLHDAPFRPYEIETKR